jgi:RNA polymerase sigma factor (sigma-70 family)
MELTMDPGAQPVAEPADNDLLQRWIGAGDREALAGLFIRLYRPAHAVATRLCGSAADDAIQEGFLTAMRRARPRHAGDARGWVLGVVANAARMQARGAARRQRHEAGLSRREADQPAGEDPEPRLDLLLARLPAHERVAVELRFVDGLSSADIGRALGRKAATIDVQIHRALGRLRGWLGSGATVAMVMAMLAAQGMAAEPSMGWQDRAANLAQTGPPIAVLPMARYAVLMVFGLGCLLIWWHRGVADRAAPEIAHPPAPTGDPPAPMPAPSADGWADQAAIDDQTVLVIRCRPLPGRDGRRQAIDSTFPLLTGAVLGRITRCTVVLGERRGAIVEGSGLGSQDAIDGIRTAALRAGWPWTIDAAIPAGTTYRTCDDIHGSLGITLGATPTQDQDSRMSLGKLDVSWSPVAGPATAAPGATASALWITSLGPDRLAAGDRAFIEQVRQPASRAAHAERLRTALDQCDRSAWLQVAQAETDTRAPVYAGWATARNEGTDLCMVMTSADPTDHQERVAALRSSIAQTSATFDSMVPIIMNALLHAYSERAKVPLPEDVLRNPQWSDTSKAMIASFRTGIADLRLTSGPDRAELRTFLPGLDLESILLAPLGVPQ